MSEIIKLEKGISLVEHDDYYTVEYGGNELARVDSEYNDDFEVAEEDATRIFNGILLGIRLVDTYGIEVFRAVEKVIGNGAEE